jgi:hypothetical protein
MKRTKLKQRISQAVTAFWDDDQENYEQNGLSLANESGLLNPDSAVIMAKNNGDTLVKILKRTFIFLPGAFYLFFGTLSVLSFEFFWNPWSILAIFLIGSFMTIFGIGKIKNPKQLSIPLSIVAVGITAFLLFSTLGGLKYVFQYGIYFFPIALIVSILARDWTDNSQDQ